MLIGRDERQVQFIWLIRKSRRRPRPHHPAKDRAIVVDLDSDGTRMDGWRVRARPAVRTATGVDVGPYALLFNGIGLLPRGEFWRHL